MEQNKELNRDDYCDDCWKIVSGENEEVKTETHADDGPAKGTTLTATSTSGGPDVKSDQTEKTITKVPAEDDSAKRSPTVKSEAEKNELYPAPRSVTVKSVDRNELRTRVERRPSGRSKGSIPASFKAVTATHSYNRLRTVNGSQKTKTGINFDETKSVRTLGGTSYKSNFSKHTAQSSWSIPTILPAESLILEGGKPSDSDLCLDCLVLQHQDSFEKNLLKNVYGSVEEPHECRMVPVQKRGQGKYIMVCNDVDCPRYKFWRIIEAGGGGWKVDVTFADCLPPPPEFGGSSCFVTSDNLCSKEQLVELAGVGLTPRIMDEVRPDFEVSEWYCGRRDTISRYGFKVSFLDSKQLMMNVYGECRTLQPPDSSKWRKVIYRFHGYEPGVRYVLFHHGGSGEFTRVVGGEGEGEYHPGSRMAGACVRAKLPAHPSSRTSQIE